MTLWITTLYKHYYCINIHARHLLTKYTCTHLTSRHLHTLALDSNSLYTLATYGTHYTTSHVSHLMLYDTLHLTHITSLSHISLISHSTSHTPHLFILDVCWLENQLEVSSFIFLNTLFTKLLDCSINMWLSFTST